MNQRIAVWIGAVAAAGALAVTAPLLLRQIPFFRVRQVELVGLRYLAAERVLDALALQPDQNLFDPVGEAIRRVQGMAGVVEARIERRLPGTLRVTLVERVPAAFVSGPTGMIPLDCDARPLPYDPTRGGLDLPLVGRADRRLVRTLCIVRASDLTMYRNVNWARAAGEDGVALDLGWQRVFLRMLPTTDEIKAVGAVQRHLEAVGDTAAELDARFAGWVVARRSRT
ncbi:MAG: FtsQ-type POTRA domain-containing protein [Gemmatimonadetes bacterium]|nr:FtsQ-type POTRA domain-containing protein [Gemmatimonadota bacterium]